MWTGCTWGSTLGCQKTPPRSSFHHEGSRDGTQVTRLKGIEISVVLEVYPLAKQYAENDMIYTLCVYEGIYIGWRLKSTVTGGVQSFPQRHVCGSLTLKSPFHYFKLVP